MPRRLIVGTRTSKLAMWQTDKVIAMLEEAWPDLSCEKRPFTTRGDKTIDRPLPEIGGKGLFTQELEEALLRGEIDIAVHSLKDLPVADAPGTTVGAITYRHEVDDCLVAREGWTLASLPEGAVVGTSSIRRQAQLLAARPDLEVRSIRGNVETRIRKVVEGDYHATVLARAGVERLGLTEHVTQIIPRDTMLPAPGQGAMAVQCRADDAETLSLLAAIDDGAVRAAVTAERSFLEGLGGGCSAPVGAFASTQKTAPPWDLSLDAFVGSPDGKRPIRVQASGDDPAVVGEKAAEMAKERGAGEIFAALRGPMAGKRIVVTRTPAQAGEMCGMLEKLGAVPVVIPTIRVVAVEDTTRLEVVVDGMADYDWAVFTSANGVDMFWRYLEKRSLDETVFDEVRIAAVGPATEQALRRWGVEADFVPERFLGKMIAEGMGDVKEKRVCLLRAGFASDEIVDILEKRGADVDDVTVYQTLPAEIDDAGFAELAKGVDIVTATSGSTVRNFLRAIKARNVKTHFRFACIGPIAADVARELGADVAVVADVHTTGGLVDALVAYFGEEKGK